MAQEIELKLRVETDANVSAQLCEFFSTESLVTQRLENTYFDTPSLDLNKAKVALRIRTKNDRLIQTLKTKGESVNGLHVRGEWEWDLEQAILDGELLKACEGWSADIDVESLVPVFKTDFDRHQADVNWKGSTFELAYDRGQVISKDKTAPIHEVELELKDGDASLLLELKSKLESAFPLKAHDISKAEAGYELYLSQSGSAT